MKTVLPDKFLSKMSKADRAKLGKAGATAAECEAAQIAKSEAELQMQIKSLLERNDVWPIHQPTRKKSQLKPGTPDILFCVQRTAVAWEVKMPGKSLDADQITARDVMIKNGWLYDVIRTYDEALRLFNELNK